MANDRRYAGSDVTLFEVGERETCQCVTNAVFPQFEMPPRINVLPLYGLLAQTDTSPKRTGRIKQV